MSVVLKCELSLVLMSTEQDSCHTHVLKMGCYWVIKLPRHTKEVAYKTLVRPQLEYAALFGIDNETETKKVEKLQKTAAAGGPAGDGVTGVALTICWTNSSGHPWRTAG